jgi:hypothetical protein
MHETIIGLEHFGAGDLDELIAQGDVTEMTEQEHSGLYSADDLRDLLLIAQGD